MKINPNYPPKCVFCRQEMASAAKHYKMFSHGIGCDNYQKARLKWEKEQALAERSEAKKKEVVGDEKT